MVSDLQAVERDDDLLEFDWSSAEIRSRMEGVRREEYMEGL